MQPMREPHQQRLLIPVNPPRYRFLFRKRPYTECLDCLVIGLNEMPLHPIGCGVELTNAIEWNHQMQFAG